MIALAPFHPSHIADLRLQAAQAWLQQRLAEPGYGAMLAAGRSAWSVLAAGRCLGCGGLAPKWPGSLLAWALLQDDIPKSAWVHLVRRMQQEIAGALVGDIWRIEAFVRDDFLNGHRLVQALGFRCETGPLRGWGPDGGDYRGYVRTEPAARRQEVSIW